MQIEEPVGVRSTRNRQERTHPDNKWGWHADCRSEVGELHSCELDSELTEIEHLDAFSALEDLLSRARQGVLAFPEHVERQGRRKSPDAKPIEMWGYQHLIELRPRPMAPAFRKPARLIRLYYVEPRDIEDHLFALHLASKPNGTDTAEEQNLAIRVAGKRAEEQFGSQKQLQEGLS